MIITFEFEVEVEVEVGKICFLQGERVLAFCRKPLKIVSEIGVSPVPVANCASVELDQEQQRGMDGGAETAEAFHAACVDVLAWKL
jgi:hypothetical protein